MKKRFHSTKYNIITTLSDFIIIAVALLFAIAIRLDFSVSAMSEYMRGYLLSLPIIYAVYTVVYYCAGIHKIIWQYASLKNIFAYSAVIALTGVIYFAIHFNTSFALPRGVYAIGLVVAECMLMLMRMVMRAWQRDRMRNSAKAKAGGEEKAAPASENNVMVIGGGNAAYMVIHDLKTNKQSPDHNVVCAIDDNGGKIGKVLYGVPIVGSTETIFENVKKYGIKTIIFAIPSCPNDKRVEILNICSETGCEVKMLPTLYSNKGGFRVDIKKIRKIEINDLLEREMISADSGALKSCISGKVVLVTGGGGSIGSELCRQICNLKPKKLIIFDIYENSAYEIESELKRNYPDQDVEALIGSVRDSKRLDQIFDTFRPDIVYHAAAHKHVPLMETSPNEAIKNNVFGTLNAVKAADKHGTQRFVMISTDKAVNPTSIMGASKRICEMIVQSYNKKSKTDFVAVRFGNVLGSNGSVIPLFRKQIEKGGPVTVTHPDIVRYFMTIQEAVLLVLQAGAFAKGGEIFVLDMGKPVKILDLAVKMIRLSGYEPDKDIKIEFCGLRPGEKLYEELRLDEENMTETANKMIFIGHPISINENELIASLDELEQSMSDDRSDIRAIIKKLVPTYSYREDDSTAQQSDNTQENPAKTASPGAADGEKEAALV